MTALNYQKAFARLLTDQELRNNFFQGKMKHFPDIPLSENQINDLMLLDVSMITEFSNMLAATRLSMVLNALPFTKRLLPNDFIEKNAAAYEKEEQALTTKNSPTLEEVKRFSRFIENSPAIFNFGHPYLKDVSRYEINLFILTNLPTVDIDSKDISADAEKKNFLFSKPQINNKIKIVRFEYDITKILSDMKIGNISKISKKDTILVFMFSKAKVNIKSINQSVWVLMELCDGKKTVSEICKFYINKSAETNSSAENTQENMIKILNKLIALEFLIFS